MFRLHLIPYNTRFDIIGKAKIFLTLSVILIIACFGIIFKNGLHYGIDFRGGYTFNVIANEGVTLQSLRNKLASQNLGEVVVQQFGKPNEYMIKVEKEKITVAIPIYTMTMFHTKMKLKFAIFLVMMLFSKKQKLLAQK